MLNKILFFVLLLFLSITTIEGQDISGSGTYADPYMLYNALDFDSMRVYIADNTYNIFGLANDIDCDGVTWMDSDTLYGPLMITAVDTFGFNGNNFTVSNLDIRWDRTTHTVTGENPNAYGGWIGNWITGAASNRVDTIKNVNFLNVRMFWDSTVTSVTRNPIGGILVGKLGNAGGGFNLTRFENIRLDSCVVRYSTTGSAYFHSSHTGLAFGNIWGGNSTTFIYEFYRIGISNSYNYHYGSNATTGNKSGIMSATMRQFSEYTECYITNSYTFQNAPGGRWEFMGSTLHGIMSGEMGSSTIFTDSYIYGNTIETNGRYGQASDPAHAGGWSGLGYIDNIRTYLGGNTYIRLNASPEANSDRLGWHIGNESTTLGRTIVDNYIDTTGLSASDWYGVYGEILSMEVGDSAHFQTTAEMKDTLTYNNWDFTNTWGMDGVINDGFPFLAWENGGVVGRKVRLIQLKFPMNGR